MLFLHTIMTHLGEGKGGAQKSKKIFMIFVICEQLFSIVMY